MSLGNFSFSNFSGTDSLANLSNTDEVVIKNEVARLREIVGDLRQLKSNLSEIKPNDIFEIRGPTLSNKSHFSGINYWFEDVNEDIRIVNLNEEYRHFRMILGAYSVLFSFVYYIPRVIYYRLGRRKTDQNIPGYFFIWYLSFIACISGFIYYPHFQLYASVSSRFDSSTFEKQKLTYFISKASVASITRIVSPIISLVCIQLIATHTRFKVQFLQNTAVHVILSFLVTFFVVGYTFLREYLIMSSFDSSTKIYPDQIHIDLIDVFLPAITTILFLFVRQNLSRQSIYSIEKCDSDGPTTLDRISKPVIYQTVTLFASLVAIAYTSSKSEVFEGISTDASFLYFFISAQTPVVHFILFRSLLRSKKSIRLCFLMKKTKISEVKTNGRMRREEQNENNEEVDTVDVNNIVVLPVNGREQNERVMERREETLQEENNVVAHSNIREGNDRFERNITII